MTRDRETDGTPGTAASLAAVRSAREPVKHVHYYKTVEKKYKALTSAREKHNGVYRFKRGKE
jgi:hypothetical protein